jgi:hypothetical protein
MEARLEELQISKADKDECVSLTVLGHKLAEVLKQAEAATRVRQSPVLCL